MGNLYRTVAHAADGRPLRVCVHEVPFQRPDGPLTDEEVASLNLRLLTALHQEAVRRRLPRVQAWIGSRLRYWVGILRDDELAASIIAREIVRLNVSRERPCYHWG